MIECVTPSLLIDIDELQALVEQCDLDERVRRNLEENANNHSDALEIESSASSRLRRVEEKQRFEETREALYSAWNWAVAHYQGSIDRYFVQELASLIEPRHRDVHAYRTGSVLISGDGAWMPPRAVKVPMQMEELFALANDEGRHPVERALLTHFHFETIHPFADGNGRTGRVLQNVILHHHNYVPATIETSDRDKYLNLIRAAQFAWRSRQAEAPHVPGREIIPIEPFKEGGVSHEERAFYDFLGAKIRDQFEKERSILDGFAVYRLTLRRVKDRPVIFAVKHALEGLFRGNVLGQVRLTDSKKGIFSITGDVSPEQIATIIDREKAYKNGYKLKRI